MKLRIDGMTYKVGLYGKIYYLTSDNHWLRSEQQDEVKDALKVLCILNDVGTSNRKTLKSTLGWSGEKTKIVCSYLNNNDLTYSVKSDIFLKFSVSKDLAA